MTIFPDGVQAAADRELEFHPKRPSGSPITAWQRRANTIALTISTTNRHTDEIAAMRLELEALKEVLRSLPF